MLEEVKRLAAAMAGAESEALEPLCRTAMELLQRQLKAEYTAEDCGQAFPCAAAALAAASLLECEGAGAVSFRAGDVSVTAVSAAERSKNAAALRRMAEELMAPWLEQELAGGFAFVGVRG